MKTSITLYDALASIGMPSAQSKAVIDAWENEVKNLASRSDLQQTERHLNAAITGLGGELRVLIREQGVDLKASIRALEARHKIINWQFGIIFICISVPTIKLGYDFLIRALLG